VACPSGGNLPRRLSAGGTVAMPFGEQVWGDEFGMCTDKFGVT
jgi:PhnB protein